MKPQDELDIQLKAKLEPLQQTQPRDAAIANHGKNRFLAEARGLAVTSLGLKRHTVWKDNFKSLNRKEKAPMFSTMISVFLILTALLGGSGITVAAAQTSQPGDLLYPVKLFSEDAYFQFTAGDQNHFDLVLDYAERRMAEIQNQLENGQVLPEVVQTRLQAHIQTALQLAIKDPAEAEQLLEQIRLRLPEQLQTRLQQSIPDLKEKPCACKFVKCCRRVSAGQTKPLRTLRSCACKHRISSKFKPISLKMPRDTAIMV